MTRLFEDLRHVAKKKRWGIEMWKILSFVRELEALGIDICIQTLKVVQVRQCIQWEKSLFSFFVRILNFHQMVINL